MPETPKVAVLVAAYNAENRIGRAVRSALDQQHVSRVVVVDDASRDRTAAAAAAADDGTGRLQVLALSENKGPSAARNAGLKAVSEPLVAILDSDDFFLPGRFDALLRWPKFDFIADNILFVPDDVGDLDHFGPEEHRLDAPDPISMGEFVRKNISRRGVDRGEFGFLKPVIRRDFLDRHGLRYDERLRFGEDFDLYARMLGHGARFLVTRSSGYVAAERADSLSARHSAEDLCALARSDEKLLRDFSLTRDARAAVRRHRAHVLQKYRHRRFLETKREQGLARAIRQIASSPHSLAGVTAAIALDKLHRLGWRIGSPTGSAGGRPRYLLPPA